MAWLWAFRKSQPLLRSGSSGGRTSDAGVAILIADDVILAEVGAGLNLDQDHRDAARILQSVHRAQGT